MRDYIFQRTANLMMRLDEGGNKMSILGALNELNIMAITFREWESSDMLVKYITQIHTEIYEESKEMQK